MEIGSHLRRTAWMSLALAVTATNPSSAGSQTTSSTVAGPAPSGAALSGAILFSRAQLNPDSTLRNSSLWVTDAAGTRPVTRIIDGVRNEAGSWSPDGTRIAFARSRITSRSSGASDIYVVNRDGGRAQRLTSGAGSFDSPAWGPANEIAFVSHHGDRDCLSLVAANGREKPRDLFCPPDPSQVKQPVWSADGRSLLVLTGYFVSELDPLWRAMAYRVDAATGAADLLSDGVLEEPRHLEFAPDGSRGVFSGDYAGELSLVDFATNTLHPLGTGYAPRWSHDGRHIAFTGEVYEGAPDFRYYEPLFVMDADGGNVRRVTRSRVDHHAYMAADWSKDGTHLLVTRRIYTDPALTIPRLVLRVVDVTTGRITALPSGQAQANAWFEP